MKKILVPEQEINQNPNMGTYLTHKNKWITVAIDKTMTYAEFKKSCDLELSQDYGCDVAQYPTEDWFNASPPDVHAIMVLNPNL